MFFFCKKIWAGCLGFRINTCPVDVWKGASIIWCECGWFPPQAEGFKNTRKLHPFLFSKTRISKFIKISFPSMQPLLCIQLVSKFPPPETRILSIDNRWAVKFQESFWTLGKVSTITYTRWCTSSCQNNLMLAKVQIWIKENCKHIPPSQRPRKTWSFKSEVEDHTLLLKTEFYFFWLLAIIVAPCNNSNST